MNSGHRGVFAQRFLSTAAELAGTPSQLRRFVLIGRGLLASSLFDSTSDKQRDLDIVRFALRSSLRDPRHSKNALQRVLRYVAEENMRYLVKAKVKPGPDCYGLKRIMAFYALGTMLTDYRLWHIIGA